MSNLMLASIFFKMGMDLVSIKTVEREPGEDRISGLLIVTMGPAALLRVSDVLVPLLEGRRAGSKLFSIQCVDSAEQVWERMESKGVQWQFLAQEFDYQKRLVSLFFLIGDDLCAAAKESLKAAMVIPEGAL